jgi:putative two-component system response regulator
MAYVDKSTTGKILVVDDNVDRGHSFVSQLTAQRYAVTVTSTAEHAFDILADVRPDVILVNVNGPGATGPEVCRRLRADSRTAAVPLLMVASSQAEQDSAILPCDSDADMILFPPVSPVQLRLQIRSLVRLTQLTDDVHSAEVALLSVCAAIESRVPWAKGRGHRVGHYAQALGLQLAMPARQITTLHRAGVLHDIGYVGVPDAILMKRGELTAAERLIVQSHPIVGDEVCATIRSFRDLRPIVRSHHERLDGTGYPDGLRGYQIPLGAHVLGIADAYEAMTNPRPHRSALTMTEAIAALKDEAARGVRQPDVVEALAEAAAAGRLAIRATGEAGLV